MYDYGYGNDSLISSLDKSASAGIGALIWIIIALIASIVGCFLIYFMFVNKNTKLKNEKLEWLRSYLRFDKMLVETILKIVYIFAALFLTLFSFVFFANGFVGFLMFLGTVIFGNLGLRVAYELVMMKIMIWKNTTEIKEKLK